MKEMTIYIRPEKLEKMKEVLDTCNCNGFTVVGVMGCGNQRGFAEEYRGVRSSINLVPKMKIEAVVHDEDVEQILTKVQAQIADGKVGNGKVFVKNVEGAMRIRTGERGDAAL
jgi:nitrogen regulatory protein P-II 1